MTAIIFPPSPAEGETHPVSDPRWKYINGRWVAYSLGATGLGIGVTDGDKGGIVVSGAGAVWTLDVVGATDIGAALADDDMIPVYDTSVTANRKSAVSRLWTYIKELIESTNTGIAPYLTSYREKVYAITPSPTFVIDLNNGSIQTITLGASSTPTTVNFADGQSVTLFVDDGSGYTITWTSTTFGTGGNDSTAIYWLNGAKPTLATTGYTVVTLVKISGQVYGRY
jgi:hypothetical protein